MSAKKKNVGKKYDRVMPRVYNSARSLQSTSFVTRHQTLCGAKPSGSSCGIVSELPTVLNDYKVDSPKRTFVVKPRRTLKSLDPALSPVRNQAKEVRTKQCVRTGASAPSVREEWPESHVRQCLSSRSHCRLKELRNEIKAYQETEKFMRFRSQLYKTCGVVLDDTGHIAEDKAVQAELDIENKPSTER